MRLYAYVGPEAIRQRVADQPRGARITALTDLLARIARHSAVDLVAATFVIDVGGSLVLAERHSEHVACAGGEPVRSAGELFFSLADPPEVIEASNQSTGYCPEPGSWPTVAAALDAIGAPHPGRFTLEIVFRRCLACGERNVVKDEWFTCALCGAALPEQWNFG